jgi:arsenite methyltransferase
MEAKNLTRKSIQEYYGEVLKTKADLQTSACCTVEAIPEYLRDTVRGVHEEVQKKFYGCGSPIPMALEGATVLDLGCGTGRDCFVLSKLVGPKGRVIGVDMTEAQLAVANQYVDYHTKLYGYASPNVTFSKGYIEDLESLGLENNSVDVVVSNCVLNLSPDKTRVFSEIFRVLKPGGELYFSDVFCDRRIPAPLQKDPLLLGECLGGAMYTEDFRRLLLRHGCSDFRVVNQSPIDSFSKEVRSKVGNLNFKSITIRAFKLETLEDKCEDFGQVAYYLGTIPEAPHKFVLDDHHTFETNRPLAVCSNTAAMVASTRFKKHFKVVGDTSVHYGLFDCAPAGAAAAVTTPGACC